MGGEAVATADKNQSTLVHAAQVTLAVPLVLYAVGYVGARPYFDQMGVPGYALSSAVFVAAGFLCAVLTCISSLACEALITQVPRHRKIGLPVWLAAFRVFTECGACLTLAWTLAQWPGVIYCCFAGVTWVMARGVLADLRSGDFGVPTFAFAGAVPALLLLFSKLVYPQASLAVGGGRPAVIRRFPLTKGQPWLKDHEGWYHDLCSSLDLEIGASVCRTVLRIHEDEKFLYLAVQDSRESCGAMKAAEPAVPFLSADSYCLVRFPSDRITKLERVP